MQAPSEAIHQSFTQVMEAYASLGYPRELLGQWALPERDAMTLLQQVEALQPRNILEVGTFVGVTTHLLALHAPAARIHSVDPNLPLRVEMSSMRSNLYDCNADIKTQELGQAVATRLGMQERIFFHAGGFSVGSTFASNNATPSARVPVIGATICTAHGPFDFVFIDALHYEDAVFADLNLAATCLTTDGVIGFHDVKGRWGSNVRRAVFRFLIEHDDFIFSHTPFTELDKAIGFLSRRSERLCQQALPGAPALQKRGLLQSTILSNLSATLVAMFAPSSVLQFTDGAVDMSQEFLQLGVKHVRTIHVDTPETTPLMAAAESPSQSPFASAQRYDLCLCLGAAEQLPAAPASQLIEACVRASDRIIFGCTPPGEMGIASPNLHPTTYWMKKFLQHGYVFKDTIRPRLEPLTYFDIALVDYQVTGTYLLNLYEVEREPGMAQCDMAVLEKLLVGKEERIEDLVLQGLSQVLTIFDARERLETMRQALLQGEGDLQQALQRLQQESQGAQQQRQALQGQLDNTRQELCDTQARLQTAQAQWLDTQRELQDTQTQLQVAQAQCQDTQERAHIMQAALARYQSSRFVRLAYKLTNKLTKG